LRGSARRIASLGRGEAVLLRRNAGALATALVGPILLVVVPFSNSPDPGRGAGFDSGSLVVTSLTTFTLILGVYYNLVTALVARREESVLKRLRTGEATDPEIIVGTAAPAIAVSLFQIAIGILTAFILFDMGAPTNPVLVLAAIALGTVVCVLFASAMTALATSVEMTQLIATPAMVVSMIFSGVMFPLDLLPEPVQRVADGLPLTQVVELLRLGLTGTPATGSSEGLAGSFGAALVPAVILATWVGAGAWAVRRWFRWEPRR
nr:ABC transporter permease [Propionibacteriales bacterium]